MKKVFLALCLLIAASGARAQQYITGDNINDFTRVAFSGTMSVTMIEADQPQVQMELHNTDPSRITWGVTDGTLSIRVKPMPPKGDAALIVKVYYRRLESLSAVGSDVTFADTLRSKVFSADCSSGAKFSAVADCMDLELRLTGNSVAQLTGASKYASFDANQRSRIDARGMQAASVDVHSYMGSEIYAWALERIVTRTNTGGAIFYRGEPVVVRSTNNTGGNVNYIGK